MKWLVTGHRDWESIDIAQLEIEAPTLEEATELARKEIDSRERAGAWVKGEPHLRDSCFIGTPAEAPWA